MTDDEGVDGPSVDPDGEQGSGGTGGNGREGDVAADSDVEEAVDDAGPGPDEETVEITVPANLLQVWKHRARTAKLSQSEYVVRMAEAGRMSIQMHPANDADGGGSAVSVDSLGDEIVEQLRNEEVVSWEQLVDAVTRNLEEDLEEALDRLQEDDVVRYSGLQGGYRLVATEDDR